MSKIVLTDVSSGFQLSKINENFQKIEDELNNKVLYRDAPSGEPNALEKDLDINGKSLYNVGDISLLGHDGFEEILAETEDARDAAISAATDAQNEAISAAASAIASGASAGESSGFASDAEISALSAAASAITAAAEVGALAVSSGAALVGFTQSGTGAVAQTVDSKLKQSISVKDFGAIGDGVADDTAAIQAAIINAASIFFPAGTYRVTGALTAGAKRIYGETQSLSVLKLDHSGVGLNFVNTDIYGLTISNIAIEGNGSSTAIVIESTTEVTSHAHFDSVRIYNHAYGIRGLSTFTLFDAYLEKVDFIACSNYGFKLSGSQNTLISCSFRLCGWGIMIDAPSGVSIGGATLEGGVFIGNTYDIVTNTTTVRPLSFRNVWFEQTATLTFGKLTGVSEVFFQTMTFDGCLFQPKATAAGNGVIDGFNYKGVVSFRNCIVFTDLYASGTLPAETVGLGDSNMILSRQSCCTVSGAGTVTPLKDFTTNSKINFYNVFDQRKYANDAAAGSAGLTYGDVYYNTTTGSVSLKN